MPVYRDVVFPNTFCWIGLSLALWWYLTCSSTGHGGYRSTRAAIGVCRLNRGVTFALAIWQAHAQQVTDHSYINWLATWNAILSMAWKVLHLRC
jgi:hypothetical protein